MSYEAADDLPAVVTRRYFSYDQNDVAAESLPENFFHLEEPEVISAEFRRDVEEEEGEVEFNEEELP